jgi:glycosyltransferase involved in cell wall biosynthesis
VTLGRGSAESEGRFREALNGSRVEYSALGILPAEGVSRILAASDVALFVRGCVSTQRGSAIASIACALPLVAYADSRLAAPLTEAGVVPVPCGDRESLAREALRVLTDGPQWRELHQRSERAHQRYFSWEAVGGRFAELLSDAPRNHA